jgi:outer membrane protein assembly factor BamE (lipoprotein component of BamABCDE complex)
VKPGMTEDEVKAILGSPYPWEKSDSSGRKTLKWMFHPDGVMGWDITIDFKDGKVQRVEKFYG